MTLADEIREYANQNYIDPARNRGGVEVTIRAGDIHKRIGLSSRLPAVCGALGTNKFEKQYGVRLVGRKGPNQGSNVFFTFKIWSWNQEDLVI
ncbi:MAG: hypothetical protein E3J35_09455 [Methanomassiliicoccales archaeon]|nr:MAG: hypothetical protein E3J35_09455 [Methanomassiliicoccales archaeon]